MTKNRHKLQIIADEVGCSVPTVSRALNGKTVSRDNHQKIVEAMHRLNFGEFVQYRIGLIVPDSSNPYFSQLAFAFENELESRGAQVLITSADGRLDRELKLVNRFLGMRVDGLIYCPTSQGAQALLNLVADGNLPVLVFDRKISSGNFDFVTVNSRTGTLRAVDYLSVSGHCRIGYIKGLKDTFTAVERFESFVDAMAKNGLDVEDSWIFDGDYSLAAGLKAAERTLMMDPADRPTAILAANDLMAIGLMHRLQQEGWKLPEQMSVIGFDNIEWSAWTNPSLTTIAQPVKEVVRHASTSLMDRIAGRKGSGFDRTPPAIHTIEPKLMPRASVCAPWQAGIRGMISGGLLASGRPKQEQIP